MNSAIELHDSTIAAVDRIRSSVVIRLAPAYVHRSEGQPGIDATTGWHQDFDLVISDAVVESCPKELNCWIADGNIAVGDTLHDNWIPLPFACAGPTSVKFWAITQNSEELVIHGSAAEIVPRSEPQFVEDVSGR